VRGEIVVEALASPVMTCGCPRRTSDHTNLPRIGLLNTAVAVSLRGESSWSRSFLSDHGFPLNVDATCNRDDVRFSTEFQPRQIPRTTGIVNRLTRKAVKTHSDHGTQA
jgi:hypothetical protein